MKRVALGVFAGEHLLMEDGVAVGLDRGAYEIGEDVWWECLGLGGGGAGEGRWTFGGCYKSGAPRAARAVIVAR
ncbi:hypothetical protein NE236_30170 [Actinoallomurus purpureus]|uniref:hypothetical protein n=1 Tax=Actinoallomurus purpureus TaxID=478114 RepID=UPI0020920BB8|nr:hypothetical protein [Actinoallomurus purpureus]MCO6009245.1 hypothetical protein [Actinoallomurus purpureus]